MKTNRVFGGANLPFLTWRGWGLGLVVSIGVCLLSLEPNWVAALSYQRDEIFRGQYWRVLTGHWVHLSGAHAVGNVLGGWLIWWVFANSLTPQRIFLTILIGSLGVSAGLWWWDPDVVWYVGASGVLHGFWAVGAICALQTDRLFGWLACGGLLLKLLLEWRFGSIVGSLYLNGATIISSAHRYGAIAGLAVAILTYSDSRQSKTPH